MKISNRLSSALALGKILATTSATITQVVDHKRNITYQGISNNGVESFLNIPFGKETSGIRRFAPPEPFIIPSGSIYNATVPGPVCPQPFAGGFAYQSNATDQSEDCLRLKVARPKFTTHNSKLPVMVYIYGGGLFNGHINERTTAPDGLIHQSVENGLPVIYVAMNYRLNIFGFALSEALRSNNSLNAGLRDQRLALEWVHENIAAFGGDPNRVTIFGQSSGALSVTLQIMAYGGAKGAPFHGAIMESTALEPTMTSNLTLDTFNAVVGMTSCNSSDPQSAEALECLRSLPFETLLNITLTQQDSTSANNDGDTYLPAVDGDFLPLPASELTRKGLFTKMPVMVGWMEDDATLFTPSTIETTADTTAMISTYWPGLTNSTVDTLLSLYPTTSFEANIIANLSAEFYRSAQIFRDVLLTCPSFYFGHAMSQKCTTQNTTHNSTTHFTYENKTDCAPVYIYNQNQTILSNFLDASGLPGLGVIHTSDLAYVYGNFSLFEIPATESTIIPSASDFALLERQSRSWSTFAHLGNPSLGGNYNTLKGWEEAYEKGDGLMEANIFIVGGGKEGISTLEGDGSTEAVAVQKLRERCGFLNSQVVIEQLDY